jgi:hypothetical protein
MKIILAGAQEFNVRTRTLHSVCHLCAYKLQLVQALQPNGCPQHEASFHCQTEGDHTDEDNEFLASVQFTDKNTFHTFGNAKHHVSKFGALKTTMSSGNMSMIVSSLMWDQVIAPFFLKNSVSRVEYLDKVEQFVVPQL